jgi:hypothetical protein
MGVEGEEEIQTKVMGNLFNKIIAETSLNLRKRRTSRCRKLTEHQTIMPKEKHPKTYHNQNPQHTEQRKNTENCKREGKSHIKADPLE